MKDAEEGDCGLLVAGGHGAPFLDSGPETLDEVAVVVDPVLAGDGGLVAPDGDGEAGAEVPDVLAKRMGGVTAIGHDPLGHAGQAIEQGDGLGQFVGHCHVV